MNESDTDKKMNESDTNQFIRDCTTCRPLNVLLFSYPIYTLLYTGINVEHLRACGTIHTLPLYQLVIVTVY